MGAMATTALAAMPPVAVENPPPPLAAPRVLLQVAAILGTAVVAASV
jgi:hypothetical protein